MTEPKARASKAKPRKRAPKPSALVLPDEPPEQDEIDRIYERLGEIDEAVDQLGKMLVELSARVALLGSLIKKRPARRRRGQPEKARTP